MNILIYHPLLSDIVDLVERLLYTNKIKAPDYLPHELMWILLEKLNVLGPKAVRTKANAIQLNLKAPTFSVRHMVGNRTASALTLEYIEREIISKVEQGCTLKQQEFHVRFNEFVSRR